MYRCSRRGFLKSSALAFSAAAFPLKPASAVVAGVPFGQPFPQPFAHP
jgi:hypothetical protein